MSLTSFLSQAPMQYVPTSGQTSTQLPQWYNDYTQGILSNAAQWANQGYQAYPGPRVAPLSGDQQTSYGTVAGTQGLGQGTAMQGFNTVQNAAGQPNALQAGSPFVGAAASPISGQMGQFMNPYLNNVVNANNFLTNRAFTEQALPSLQNQFTQAGQVYGGSNQGVLAERMARDLNLNQQISNASTLAGGFNTALGGAEAQAGIYGGLAGTAGNLANTAQQTGIGAGYGEGALGTMAQQNAISQAQAQNAMGQQQQQQTQQNYNTAYQDFLNQVNYPLTAASGMQGALSGIQVPQGTQSYNYSPYGFGLSPLASGAATGAGLNSMLGPGGLLSGNPNQPQQPGITINYGGTPAPGTTAARGGLVRMARGGRVTLKLRRGLPSIYQQWKKQQTHEWGPLFEARA